MKKLLLLFILVVLVIAFIKFGRSIYVPVLNQLKEPETIQSVFDKIQGGVWDRLKTALNSAGYETNYPEKIILVAFKEEQKLQVYANDSNKMILLKEYPFTAYSGKLGPKLQEGDRQIPEGIYEIEYLNPNSSYYLSIKVSYPNEFDKSKTKFDDFKEMGGDIFIHGKAATIGCIPIGDQAIEEVFVLAKEAFNNKIKVIISPRDFRVNNQYPAIEDIDWERELYEVIEEELKRLPLLE